MEDNLEILYQIYEGLSNAQNVAEHSDHYLKAIQSTKGTYKEKRLASQIIPKFFKHFPALQDKAIDAILDLCEDTESSVRICAIKELPVFCKNMKEHTAKVSDILAQLLQLEDQDLVAVRNSLMQVFKQEPVIVTKAIFNHIHGTTEVTVREKCLNNLFTYLMKTLESPNQEVEDLCVSECKNAIQDASCTEFIEIVKFLKSTKMGKTLAGQQTLLNIISEQAELDREFDPVEQGSNNVDRLITCIDYALPYFSVKNESNKFVIYICDQVLPQFDIIGQLEDGEMKQLHLLRHLARLSAYCGKLDNPSLCVVQIFDKIKNYMPVPPDNVDVNNLPNLDFSSVECLLYAFHQLARQCPDFLTHDPAVLQDFRNRLTYFSRVVQGSSKALSQSRGTILLAQDKFKAKLAPKILSNINSLIKDLFYKPPVYKCNVTLSFIEEENRKPTVVAPEPAAPKRHQPITFEKNGSASKQQRPNKPGENLQLYTPPSGKFSNNFQSYDRTGGGRPRGRGRGRGRGVGRNWRN